MRCTAAPKVTLAIWLNKKSALHAVVLDGDGDTYDRVTRCIKRRRRWRRRRRHNHCNSISQERRKLSSFEAKNPSPHSFCSINLADKSRIRVGRLCVLSWRKMSETAAAAQPVKSVVEGDMYIITRIPHFIRGQTKQVPSNQLNAFAELKLTRPGVCLQKNRGPAVECRVSLLFGAGQMES